ncbi:TrbC/VirB2 family protein [Gilliamella sp. B2865]|uniref:TrbC/VirB2 family protein n=1 Tax=Gilliamella sp. B2865 TaxID=2817984 RepID=UPI002269D74D|nr:TrbC/VirB2 family protein [Gilliamella sp. B2865]MCX8680303.1 TrbC/VirB2 family protein [Gilliamella sp. B2865]
MKKINTFLFTLLFSCGSFAAGGISKVNSTMQIVSDVLSAIAVVTVTIAIMWAGYKVLFKGDPMMEGAKILSGGVLIGAAAQIASVLVG